MASSIVVFCAHSDDQILGAGGALAHYASEGFEVYTVIFSFGELSHPWLKEKVAAEIRVRESEDADKIIGGKGVVFFGLTEGKFEAEIREKNVLEKVRKIIEDRKPAKIFTLAPDDPQPDHSAVYRTVVKAVNGLNYKGNVFSFDIWNPINIRQRSHPQLYVDTGNTFEQKIRAMSCFRSQWMAINALRFPTLFRDFFNGIAIGSRFAERFYRIR